MSALNRTIRSWLPILCACLVLSSSLHANDDINENEQAYLDQVLAPIALYPDTVLSHVLIASTYPLEVVQASRWARNHAKVSSDKALQLVEQESWDPSVKALVAFPDLLQRMSDDLDWLEQLGEAFLDDEAWVMQSIQQLREQAYLHGSLNDVEHIVVQREHNVIVIEPKQAEIIYVPYYNTTMIYGDWHWPHHQPYYWHYPGAYYTHSAFYWGPYYRVTPRFYFSSFHWHQRHVIVNHHHYYQPPRVYPRRVVHVHHGQRWQHNPVHRRGVVYRRDALNHRYTDRPRSYTREERGPAKEWRRPPRRQASGDVTSNYRHQTSERQVQSRYEQQHHSERTANRAESLRRGASDVGERSIRQQDDLELRRQQLADRQQHDSYQGTRSNRLQQRREQLTEQQQVNQHRTETTRRSGSQLEAQQPIHTHSQPSTTQQQGNRQRSRTQQDSPTPRQQQALPVQPQQRIQSARQQSQEVRAIRQQSTPQQQVQSSSRPAQTQTPPARTERAQSQPVQRVAPSRPQATESRASRSTERRQRQID